MQKSGDAAIPMRTNFDEIKVLFPTSLDIDAAKQLSALQPFNEDAVNFLHAISQELLKNPRVKDFPDVATFAFYCRKANILNIRDQYNSQNILWLGRGIVFHIAPSNVPVNFAYSLLTGILTGNINIVRLPSKEFEQVTIICNAILKVALTGHYNAITNRTWLVRYDRQSEITSNLSSICDVRVIWGGDSTIELIRRSSLPPRSFDVTFADRYSICIINADSYITEAKPEKVALAFYNDTYLFDQNACTAPHLIVWLGTKENVNKSKDSFWRNLYKVVKLKYSPLSAVIAVDKLTAFYNQAIQFRGNKAITDDNLIWRINLATLPVNIDEIRCTSGFFYEYHASSIDEINSIINRKYQTLAYYGMTSDDLTGFFTKFKPMGIDRIVPIGKTTDFSLIWDGYDLITTLSRRCDLILK